MNTNHTGQGRISEHFHGLGTVTPEMVEERARQLALIDGRSVEQVNAGDIARAKAELMGVESAAPADEGSNPLPVSKRWDPVPGSVGHRVEPVGPDDPQDLTAGLVEEGMEEAEHERMVEGSKEGLREDRGEA